MNCEFYYTQEAIKQITNPLTGGTMPHRYNVGVCWGRKDRDECSCGGNKDKCDFYVDSCPTSKNAEPNPLTEALEVLKGNPTEKDLIKIVRLLLTLEAERGRIGD